MSRETRNYLADAESDAKETVQNFRGEILEQLMDKGKASDDLLDDRRYPNGDAWHHESHVDKCYSLYEAAILIDQLSEHEETDSGLWEGQQPKEAISTCAAFTYGNAVYCEFQRLIEEINNDAAADIIAEYDEKIDAAEEAAENPDENPDVETLREEKREALRKLIAETADNA